MSSKPVGLKDFDLRINTDSLEATRCLHDFLYFLKYVMTTTVDGEVKKLPLDWPYVKKLATALLTQNRLVILKARQILCSWIIVAYAVWLCLNQENLIILIISKDHDAAKEMIRRAYEIYDRLPEFLKILFPLKDGPRNKQNIEWASASRIISLPSKADASRGVAAKIVFIDEAAYCRELKEMLGAIEPQLGPNSKLFAVSTPNGKMIGKEFTALCKESDQRGYRRFDIHYKMCPKYQDPDWERQKRASMSPQKFAHEYELSLATAGDCMIFGTFRDDKHIMEESFVPTSGYTLFRCIDPGPKFACIWFAQDSLGNIIVYRELHIKGQSYAQRAKRILNLSGEELYEATLIDSADPQAKLDLAKNLVFSRLCLKKDVMESIDMINCLLAGDGIDMPMIQFTLDTIKLIQQIRDWIGDDCGYPVKKQEDHGIDALRYGVHFAVRRRFNRSQGIAEQESVTAEADEDLDMDLYSDIISNDGGSYDRDFNEDAFELGY